MDAPPKAWDVFISHASEDKDSFARPLAVALRSLGVSVWYDEFSLRLGDSLSGSIDRGLAGSRFGIVVITPSFIGKPYTEYELHGLVARDLSEGRVILPLWHGVTKGQVMALSPPLADKCALLTADLDAQGIAIKLLLEIRPDLYRRHPRADLERLASGVAVQELQAELDAVREQLAEYLCPHCGSRMVSQVHAPADPQEDNWDVRESFECGFQRFGSSLEQLCPADPRFPRFEDYELRSNHDPRERHWEWQCYAVPKTDAARLVRLCYGVGRSQEEAEREVREHYDRISSRAGPRGLG